MTDLAVTPHVPPAAKPDGKPTIDTTLKPSAGTPGVERSASSPEMRAFKVAMSVFVLIAAAAVMAHFSGKLDLLKVIQEHSILVVTALIGSSTMFYSFLLNVFQAKAGQIQKEGFQKETKELKKQLDDAGLQAQIVEAESKHQEVADKATIAAQKARIEVLEKPVERFADIRHFFRGYGVSV